MREALRRQVEQFRAADQARWEYEADRRRRESEILLGLGRSDEEVREQLKKAGVNVSLLDKDFSQSGRRRQQAREELYPPEAAPPRVTGKNRLSILEAAALAGSPTPLAASAVASYGDPELCGFNAELGEFNISGHTQGSGWGWGAEGLSVGHYCTLLFAYVPQIAGELQVTPHIDCHGHVWIWAQDHWYTHTQADLEIKIYYDLYQHYWDGEQVFVLVDEHHSNALRSFWIDQHVVMTKSLSVSAHDVVWIKITIYYVQNADSSDAEILFDFRTGSENRIRVEHIFTKLTPFGLQGLPGGTF